MKTNTPLLLAIEGGHAEVVEFLLDKRANAQYINNYDASTLQLAIEYKHENMAKLLREWGMSLE